jgi:LCP family protein required for cell wall assembly
MPRTPENSITPEADDATGAERVTRARKTRTDRQAERTARKRTRHRIIAVVALLAVAAAAGYTYYRYDRIADALGPSTPGDKEAVAGVADPIGGTDDDPEAPLYILILGSDARPGETRARSDTIILARVDQTAQRITMLSFPRDSRVEIPGYGLDKITHANLYGGPALVMQTVKDLTGLPIHHYAELDFEGFVALVDAVGGVEVTLDEALWDRRTGIAGGLPGVTYIPEGTQWLDSAQALAFVRSRAYPDGDFTRVKNQQKFLVAFIHQVLTAKNLPRLPSIADAMADNVETSMRIPEVIALAQDFKDLSEEQISGYSVPATTAMIDGVSYVVLDEREAPVLYEEFAEGVVGESAGSPQLLKEP